MVKTRIFHLWGDTILTAQQQFVAVARDFWQLFSQLKHWGQILWIFYLTMPVFYGFTFIKCAHMPLILPWALTFSAWVNRAVIIECDSALYERWGTEPSFRSSYSVPVSAESSESGSITHRVPLITLYQRGEGRTLFFPMFYKQGRPLFVILITNRSDNYQDHFFLKVHPSNSQKLGDLIYSMPSTATHSCIKEAGTSQ